jgi:hypothetical protein
VSIAILRIFFLSMALRRFAAAGAATRLFVDRRVVFGLIQDPFLSAVDRAAPRLWGFSENGL